VEAAEVRDFTGDIGARLIPVVGVLAFPFGGGDLAGSGCAGVGVGARDAGGGASALG
jgi:hypothetical protein